MPCLGCRVDSSIERTQTVLVVAVDDFAQNLKREKTEEQIKDRTNSAVLREAKAFAPC